MGKSTISMAIFNSYVTNYQRVSRKLCLFPNDNVVYPPASRIFETWMDSDGHLHDERGWFKQHSKTQLLDG